MGVYTRNMQSCLQKYNKLNKSHLVGQLLNSFEYSQIYHFLQLSKILSYDVKNLSVNTLKIMMCYKKVKNLLKMA